MNILLVTEFFPSGKDLKFSGGVETRTFHLAKYLAKKHKVFVLTSRQSQTKRLEKIFGFTTIRVDPTRPYDATAGNLLNRIRFIKEAVKVGKQLDIDIVDGGNFISHFVARLIARAKNVPVVAWYPDVWVGSWFKNVGILGIYGEILERLNLLWGFDLYIAISKLTAEKLKKHTKGKIHVIPCGIDKHEFSISSPRFTYPTIICISRLAKYKRLRTLFYAFALINLKFKMARLVIVGSGPELKNLTNLAKNLNIKSKVKFLSNLPRIELIKTLKSSSLFSLPSEVEGFGISIIEACAAGVPYVVSDIAVFKEITTNGLGGLFFELGNPHDLAFKIEELLSDKRLYLAKVKEGTKLVEKYQWSAIARQTEAVYMNLIDQD